MIRRRKLLFLGILLPWLMGVAAAAVAQIKGGDEVSEHAAAKAHALALSKASYTDAVGRLGDPEETDEFAMSIGVPEFRIELRNFFSDADLETDAPKIKEATWAIDNESNLTLWFEKDGEGWRQLHHLTWHPGTSF